MSGSWWLAGTVEGLQLSALQTSEEPGQLLDLASEDGQPVLVDAEG